MLLLAIQIGEFVFAEPIDWLYLKRCDQLRAGLRCETSMEAFEEDEKKEEEKVEEVGSIWPELGFVEWLCV